MCLNQHQDSLARRAWNPVGQNSRLGPCWCTTRLLLWNPLGIKDVRRKTWTCCGTCFSVLPRCLRRSRTKQGRARQGVQHISMAWDTEVFPSIRKWPGKPHIKTDGLSTGEQRSIPNAIEKKWEATCGNESSPGLHLGKGFWSFCSSSWLPQPGRELMQSDRKAILFRIQEEWVQFLGGKIILWLNNWFEKTTECLV